MTTRQHRLSLGNLDLLGDYGDYRFETLADEATFGNPQPLEVAITSLIMDGAIVATQRHENREAFFRVKVVASSGHGLALGEAALVAELARRNTLAWTPPAGFGPTSVFEVMTSSLAPTFDDLAELRLERTYGLRLVCLPFARSVNQVMTAPTPVGVGPAVSIDACNAITGWTSTSRTVTADTTMKAEGTASIRIGLPAGETYESTSSTQPNGYRTLRFSATLTKTFPATSMINAPYLVLQVASNVRLYQAPTVEVSFDGGPWRTAATSSATAGWRKYSFEASGVTFTKLAVRITQLTSYQAWVWTPPPPAGAYLWLDDIRAEPHPLAAKSATLRSVPITGTVRAPASLMVDASAGGGQLGNCLVYTAASLDEGYRPDLRWRMGGSATTDAAAMNGSYLNLTPTGVAPTLSYSGLTPGAYAVLGRIYRDGDTTPRVTIDGTTLNANTTGKAISAYQIYDFGVIHLGGRVAPEARATSNVSLRVFGGSGDGGVDRLDELWLFSLDGELTWIDTSSSTRLWIDAPSMEQPRGGIWTGSSSDRSDALRATTSVRSRGMHMFKPPTTMLYVATTGAKNPAVTVAYHPHWHTNAAA